MCSFQFLTKLYSILAMSFLDEITKLTTAAPSIDPELVGFADQSAFISSKATVSLLSIIMGIKHYLRHAFVVSLYVVVL